MRLAGRIFIGVALRSMQSGSDISQSCPSTSRIPYYPYLSRRSISLTMLSTRRASQILVALAAWAFVSAALSLLIIKVAYTSALPASLPNLASDINGIQDLAALKRISILLVNSVSAQKEAGWLIVSWGLWFVAIWAAIFAAASTYLYRCLLATDSTENTSSTETFLDLALAGKLELWKAFWGLYIVLPLAASLVSFGLLAILKSIHVIEPAKVADLILTPLAYAAVMVIYLGAAAVAWRCSANTSWKVWGILARIAIVLYTGIPLAKSVALLSQYLGR